MCVTLELSPRPGARHLRRTAAPARRSSLQQPGAAARCAASRPRNKLVLHGGRARHAGLERLPLPGLGSSLCVWKQDPHNNGTMAASAIGPVCWRPVMGECAVCHPVASRPYPAPGLAFVPPSAQRWTRQWQPLEQCMDESACGHRHKAGRQAGVLTGPCNRSCCSAAGRLVPDTAVRGTAHGQCPFCCGCGSGVQGPALQAGHAQILRHCNTDAKCARRSPSALYAGCPDGQPRWCSRAGGCVG